MSNRNVEVSTMGADPSIAPVSSKGQTAMVSPSANVKPKQTPKQASNSNPEVEAPMINQLSPDDIETHFLHALSLSNSMSSSEGPLTEALAMAKLANACIRMLHSQNWKPRTVVRTMVHMELEPERKVTGLMHQSLREIRDEARARRAAKTANHVNGNSGQNGPAEVTSVVELKNGNNVGTKTEDNAADAQAVHTGK